MSVNVQSVLLPEPLLQEAARHAEQLRVSTQEWVRLALEARLRLEQEDAEIWRERAARASGRRLSDILGDGPDSPPDPGDELPEGWPQAK